MAREKAHDVAPTWRRINTPILTQDEKDLLRQYLQKVCDETGIRINAGQAVWMAALKTMRAELSQPLN